MNIFIRYADNDFRWLTPSPIKKNKIYKATLWLRRFREILTYTHKTDNIIFNIFAA